MKWLHIRYGVTKPGKRRNSFTVETGSLRVVGSWKADATHAKIRARIRAKHPGAALQGYCVALRRNGGAR